MNKILLSASALAFGLAISGAALASQSDNSNTADHHSTVNQTQTQSADVGNSGAQTTNSNNSTPIQGNDTGNNQSTNVSVSKPVTITADNGNNQSTNVSVSKPIASDNTTLLGSNDHNGNDVGNNQSHTTSISKTESTSTSFSLNFSGPLTLQDLSANVSGNSSNANSQSTGAASLTTGGSSSFAGVQTSSINSGVQSINQAATAVAATGSSSF